MTRATRNAPTKARPGRSAGPWRRIGSATRLLVAVVVAAVVGTACGALLGWSFLPLTAWVAGAAAFLGSTWVTVWPADAEDTATLARREDPSRALSDAILLTAAVAAMLAVALVIFRSGHPHDVKATARLLLGVASVVSAWGVLHTVFTLKYARQFYREDAGGVNFNQAEPPAYRDFAYVAFTVGMTFQVSDTDVEHPRMRALVLAHALMSYLFGAVIIAITINLLASLTG